MVESQDSPLLHHFRQLCVVCATPLHCLDISREPCGTSRLSIPASISPAVCRIHYISSLPRYNMDRCWRGAAGSSFAVGSFLRGAALRTADSLPTLQPRPWHLARLWRKHHPHPCASVPVCPCVYLLVLEVFLNFSLSRRVPLHVPSISAPPPPGSSVVRKNLEEMAGEVVVESFQQIASNHMQFCRNADSNALEDSAAHKRFEA